MAFDRTRQQLLDALLRDAEGGLHQPGAVPLADRSQPLPLSFGQERMWFLHQLEPGCHYNDRVDARLSGPLDVDALETALGRIVARHETLRTTYGEVEGRPVHRIGDPRPFTLPLTDLTRLPAARREDEALALAFAEARELFDLARGPVWRARLYRLSPSDHFLALTVHHIAVDGWSKRVLLEELAEGYKANHARRAGAVDLPTRQYVDYAAWQRDRTAAGALAPHLKFWKDTLAGAPALLNLSSDRPRPGTQSFRGARHSFEVSRELCDRLRHLEQAERATRFMVLLAGFAALLHRYTGEPDIVVGTPVANRHAVEVERLIGFFVNTIAMRTCFDEALTFRQLLHFTRETALDAYAHQELPFERLVEEIHPERDQSFNPVFQTMLILQAGDLSPVRADDLTLLPMDEPNGTAKFDLTLSLSESDGSLRGWFEYATDLFDAATVARMSRHFSTLLAAAAENPDCPVEELPLLDESERQTVVQTWNTTTADREPIPVHRLFERQVVRTPDAVAVEVGSTSMTYAELDRRANGIALRLIGAGVGSDERVGICLDPGLELFASVLGILKAGAAYVPLDPGLPPARLELMVRDAGLSIVLSRNELAALLSSLSVEPWTVEGLADEARDAPPIEIRPEQLAYVLYTSGSTGRPKGVAMPHRVLTNLIEWQTARSNCRLGARTLQFASPSFDVSFQEMFATWAAGGVLVVPPRDVRRDGSALIRFLADQQVERVFLPFVVLQSLADSAERDAGLSLSLREIITAGEALRITPALASLMARLPGCVLQNQYGPTEAHVVSAFSLAGPVAAWPALPPIGRPIANAKLYVLDRQQTPVPIGVRGELFIGGKVVARGYLGLPDLTAERFVPDPFAYGVMYRTGDAARWRADGNLEFLGRLDDQVKIRGYRVEVGEVETVLSSHPAVHAAAVVCRRAEGRAESVARLIAYVVVDQSRMPESPSFREFLAERLPEYMVPSVFVRLETFPLTTTGKLDRRRLPAPAETRDAVATPYVAPASSVEEVLAQVWSELLGVDRVGVRDSFFELGGHSLLATRLMFRVRDAFQVDVPLRRLFEDPTISGLAAAVAEAKGKSARALPLPSLQADWAHVHEPFSLTDIQQAYWVGRTASLELGGTACHMYTEVESADLDVERLEDVINRLIERHPMLRAVMLPDGRQQILSQVPRYRVALLDLDGAGEEAKSAKLDLIRQEMSWQVMAADRWPLFDVRASRLDGRRYRVHVDFDLLIGDALSIQVLVREFLTLYQNPAAELPALDVSFRDYVLVEQALQETEIYQRSKTYWLDRIPTLPPAPDVPMIANPESIQGAEFSRRTVRLDGERWTRLKRRAARSGLSPSGTLLGAFADVLTMWSRSPRYSINVTLFNRLPMHPHVNSLVGDFTSVTLLEVDHSAPQSQGSFDRRARRLQEQLWSDIDHRHFSGVRVLREMARQQGRSPRAAMPVVFTSTLNIDQMHGETASMLRRKDAVVYGISQTPQVWLDHQIYEDAGDLVVNWDAVDQLFPDGLLDDMFSAYCELLVRLIDDDAAWQSDRQSLLPARQLSMRQLVNATGTAVPEGLLHSRFFELAGVQPDAVAVLSSTRTLSYAQLARWAMAVSRELQSGGGRPNTLVALVMEKGWEQVAAVLGVLHAGAAYLPIDASLPLSRIRQLLDQGQVSTVLTQSRIVNAIEWPESVRVVSVDTLELMEEPVVAVGVQPEDLAYVIFTSGSTGAPKGVMIDHRAALNTVADVNERFRVSPADRVLALSSLSFDLSVYDVFGILAAGGALVVPGPEAERDPAVWTDLVEAHGVTIWNSVPALMDIWVEHLERATVSQPASLRLALLSGDWIPITLPDRLRSFRPDVKVVSLGGATEASIWSILYPIERVDPIWPSVPYGRPMRGQTFHVLDRALRSRPEWVPGELHIGGVGLARGYWRDPEKTGERFIVHPETGERLYATGDLGRYLPSGDIEFLGREDTQVKIQGYRVELGELETALARHPEIRAAAATATGGRHGAKRLVAFVVLSDRRVTGADLRSYLAGVLPEYMIPSLIVVLDELPLTVNGKVDRAALRVPVASSSGSDEGLETAGHTGNEDEAMSPVALVVAEICQQLLGVPRVRVSDDFFELGGDSLTAMRALLRIRQAFDVQLAVGSFFNASTVGQIAGSIEALLSDASGGQFKSFMAEQQETDVR